MSDIVERLSANVNWLMRDGFETSAKNVQCALAEIESLRQQLAEKDAKIELERTARQQLEKLLHRQAETISASQAREQQLREAVRQNQEWHENYDEYGGYPESELAEVNEEALSLPQDTSALEAMIAKAGEVMRERCFDSVQAEMDEQYIDSPPWYVAEACRDTISTLPGVTLEDLK